MTEENTNPEAEQGASQEGNPAPDLSLPDGNEGGEQGDPLDKITDPETLRHEAKKFRGIASRKDKDPEPKQDDIPAVDTSEFMTKKEFRLANERKAIQAVTSTDAEISANWEAIKPFYTPRRGKDTPEDIIEDIKDAVTLYRARTNAPASDPTKDLTTISVTGGTGAGKAPVAPATDGDHRFSTAKGPEAWYEQKS